MEQGLLGGYPGGTGSKPNEHEGGVAGYNERLQVKLVNLGH